MKFSEFKYERPSYDEIKKSINSLVDELKSANSCEKQLECINHINNVRNHLQTMGTLAQIRHSINTKDEYYDKERSYWDEYSPLYDELDFTFYKELVQSKFRKELKKNLADNFSSWLNFL